MKINKNILIPFSVIYLLLLGVLSNLNEGSTLKSGFLKAGNTGTNNASVS